MPRDCDGALLPRERYAPPAGPNLAQMIRVGYADAGLTRQETWSVQCESDAPRRHRRRVSRDNGRTWSDFEVVEAGVNVQRPDGGLVTYPDTVHHDRASGRRYAVRLRRAWPGLKLYTYNWKGHAHPFNDHVFMVENNADETLIRYEEGPEFDPEHPFAPAFGAANRAYPGSGMAFAPDGTAYYPIVCYKPGPDYSFKGGGVRLIRRDPVTGRWLASEPQYISPELSSRGLLEPDVAVLRDGRLLVVCRGSDTPATPGRKWRLVSDDGGRTLSPPEEFRYDDGSRFYSPSSIHRFFRSTRNGRLYWIANIVPEPPRGNSPRYPLVIAAVDEDKPAVQKDGIVLVDDRREGEPEAVQLSNWSQLENRETLDWEFYLTRIGEHPDRFWESGVYRYIFSPQAQRE